MKLITGERVMIGPVDDLTTLSLPAFTEKWALENTLFFLAFSISLGYMVTVYFGVLLWLIMAIQTKQYDCLLICFVGGYFSILS